MSIFNLDMTFVNQVGTYEPLLNTDNSTGKNLKTVMTCGYTCTAALTITRIPVVKN